VAHRLTWLDVFTSRPLTGNGLAVVHDADDLDEPMMLAFARETQLSETTFVQRAVEPGADYRNRIWMTVSELPFAGHPSLGTAVAVARARGERTAHYVQQTGAGLQPIDVELGALVGRASMLQEPARFGAELEPERVLAALGLDPADADSQLPAQVVGTGLDQLIVPVRDEAVLARAHPDAALLGPLLEEAGAVTAYVAWCRPEAQAAAARSYFLDARGVKEDPATGSAAGPLCAYLHARTGAPGVTIEQGVTMGRPSRLVCEAGERVRVAGDAVIVAEGELSI
jgi:trans-2,3-dihydro-3-hydroxyanthranilate isomerase